MPITCPIQFTTPNEDQFRKLDYLVMEHAFAAHNTLGRFCDEAIYQADLAHRMRKVGLKPTEIEVPVNVSWSGFKKTYYLDVVVHDSVIYELKTATALTAEHKAQLLNYLLLLGQPRGKLINLRPPSLEWHFVSTTLTPADCRDVVFTDARWHPLSPACVELRRILTSLLADWGAFLEICLYQEALMFLLGGDEMVSQRVELAREGVELGNQRVHTHSTGVAFRITAFTEHQDRCEAHLRRFLALTPLIGIQWINLNHRTVELVTLTKELV
jgi:GxxExxY protein